MTPSFLSPKKPPQPYKHKLLKVARHTFSILLTVLISTFALTGVVFAVTTIGSNIQLGSGAPDLTLDGDDLYVTGTAEVDGDLAAKTGGAATLVVAASDASTRMKNQADYVADGTADDVEIQAAIDYIRTNSPTEGGTVILSEGNFSIGSSINVDGQLVIRGQGIAATVLQLANNANTDMFVYNRADDDFEFSLEHMSLNGNKDNNTSGNGINIGTGAGTLQDVHLNYIFPLSFPERGILISSGWGLVIESVIVEFNGLHGIEVLGGNGRIVNTKVGRNSVNGGAYNLWLRGQEFMVVGNQFFAGTDEVGENIRVSGNRNVIVGNDIYNSITQENILVAGDDNNIVGNMIYAGSLGSAYGVFLHSSSNTNYVANNKFVGTFDTAIVQDDGTGNIVRNNAGWVTENSGTGTISNGSTTVTVSHGLNVTPSAGDCSFVGAENPTTDVGTLWIDTYTSTQMNLNVENDPGASNFDVSWSCQVY